MSSSFPRLFEPIRIGSRESRNRIVRLATTSGTGENGVVGDRMIAFYRRVAQGGTGMVVTEGMRVHRTNSARAGGILLYIKEVLPGYTRLAQAVHDEGALLIAQLNHSGRQHHHSDIPTTIWAPSAVACPYSGGVPHAVSKAEIADVVAGFATAAMHAWQSGCDGVEIHGGQGHLIQEFISPYSNKRDDEYGGSMENRLRFVSEIIRAVREKTAPDFIVGLRMGYEEFTPGGITLRDSKKATRHLLKLGVLDYLSLTQGNFNTVETHCPDSHFGPLPYIDMQAQIKAVAGKVTVIASTRIQTPEEAESIITAGKADMIGMSRALIADPEWPLKALQGRSADIRRCISTSSCWNGGGRLSCSINPTLGQELELPPLTRAATPRRVVVVGGGPAGLEAARVAAERGHHVVLFEKQPELGGKLAGSGRFAPHHEVIFAADYLIRQARQATIDIRLGADVDAQTVMAERPDAVIVATGATIVAPALPGDGSVPVYAFGADIPDDLPQGLTVVMDQDGYFWPAAVTEALARAGRKVVYVTRFFEPLREVHKVARISSLRAFDELGVKTYDNTTIERASKGALVLQHAFNTKHKSRLKNVAALVWLGVQQANDGLAQQLRELGVPDVRVVGDAQAPRRLASALGEGHRAARAV